MLVFSVHGDTGFPSHALERLAGGVVHGHLDNFVGVHAMMRAYFSGRLRHDDVRIEVTHGEETDFAGAWEVYDTLDEDDVVVVIDVTGTVTTADFVVEKCVSPGLQRFLGEALQGLDFVLFDDCPDPVADTDETDVYSQKCANTCMLAVPVWGGDYNAGPVYCREETIEAVAEAICRIVEAWAATDAAV